MSAKIGRGARSLVVLGRVDEKNLHWISADRTVLVTRGGRLVQTAGLPSNLRRTRLVDADPLTTLPGDDQATASFQRLVDLTPPDHYGISIDASVTALGPERIEIAELAFDTAVYREDCAAREIDWEFTNLYWIDPDIGLVWKSIQHIHPGLPPVELELLKPPAV